MLLENRLVTSHASRRQLFLGGAPRNQHICSK